MSSRWLSSFFEWLGELGIFCWRQARASVVPPYEVRGLIRQLDEVAAKSLIAGAEPVAECDLHNHPAVGDGTGGRP
jgi:hypothetical protein